MRLFTTSQPPTASVRGNPFAAAFTLIEMICALAIIAVLIAMALVSAVDWNRGAALRAAALETHACLNLSRQTAVAAGTPAWFVSGATNSAIGRGWYAVATNPSSPPVGFLHGLPAGCRFADDTSWQIRFDPDGSCSATCDVFVIIREIRPANYLAATILVYRATGYATILDM